LLKIRRLRMQLLDLLGVKLFEELHAAYRPVLHDIMALEREYPIVAQNQVKLSDADIYVMGNTQANLLYSMQGSVPEEKRQTRRQIREALVVLQHIPGIRTVVVTLLLEQFAATIYMVEHLFFLNREIERRIKEEPRSEQFKDRTEADSVYPMDRVDAIVEHAYKIWREVYVLQNAGKE
jgi:hypothetical protein